MVSTQRRGLPLAISVVVALMLGFSLAGIANADGPPVGVAGWAPYNDDVRETQDAEDGSGAGGGDADNASSSGNEQIAVAGDCTYKSISDDIHWSGPELSVHGWWDKVSSTGCPSRAEVETMLQGVWCDPRVGGCWWKKVHKQEKIIRPGGGRGKRSNARTSCVSSDMIGFRSVIDVDLVGMSDPPDKLRSAPGDWACRPPNWD